MDNLEKRLIKLNKRISRFIKEREDSENGPSKEQVPEQQKKESITKRPNQNVTSIW